MGHFDAMVDGLINGILAERKRRKDEAASMAMTANNMFGNIAGFIEELRPRLSETFADESPEISLSAWEMTGTGATSTLRLKKAAGERQIKLACVFGAAGVTIDGRTVPCRDSMHLIAAEIERFFT